MLRRATTLLLAFAVSYAAPADDFGLLAKKQWTEDKTKGDNCTTLKGHIEKAISDDKALHKPLKVPPPCEKAEEKNNEKMCGRCNDCHAECGAKEGAHDKKCIKRCLNGKQVHKPQGGLGKVTKHKPTESPCQVLKNHIQKASAKAILEGKTVHNPPRCINAVKNTNEKMCVTCLQCHKNCTVAHDKTCITGCLQNQVQKGKKRMQLLLQKSARVTSCRKLGEEHRGLAKKTNEKDDVRLWGGATKQVKQQLQSLAETCFGELNDLRSDGTLRQSKKKIPACFLRNKGNKVGFVNCLGF